MWWLHFKTIKWLLDDGVVRNKGCCGPLGGIHVLNLIHFYGQGLRYKIPIWCIILAWPILDTSVYSPKEVVWGWGISQSSTIFVASWTFGIHWKDRSCMACRGRWIHRLMADQHRCHWLQLPSGNLPENRPAVRWVSELNLHWSGNFPIV